LQPISAARRPGTPPLCAQIDGEEIELPDRVEIEVVPRALRLIIA
jgi:diacylglycerol kinase family enzyme